MSQRARASGLMIIGAHMSVALALIAKARLAAVNTDLLAFAPAITENELTLYFTRVDRSALSRGIAEGFGLYVSTRRSKDAPFGEPARLPALRGYVKAATVTPNGCAISFHQRLEDRFVIRRSKRNSRPE